MHYSFGLLDRTNIFSPEQAVLDDSCIGIVKFILQQPEILMEDIEQSKSQIRQVLQSSNKLFVRSIRSALRKGNIYRSHPFESDEMGDETLKKVHEKTTEILKLPKASLSDDIKAKLFNSITGILQKPN